MMNVDGKRVRPRRPWGGARAKKPVGVGRACYLTAAAFVLLLAVSLWKCVSFAAEDRAERAFVRELQSKAVSVRPPARPVAVREPELSVPTPGQAVPTPEPPTPTPELPPIDVDFELLRSENPDVVGWIYCPDTEVNYPVLQSEDNNYYLRRRSDGVHQTAGSIFADYRNSADLSDENVVLYGHNMKNGTMFALLPHYARQEFYEAHPVWYLLTPTANYKVELFAGFVTSTKSPVYSAQREMTGDGRPVTDRAWEDSDFRGVDPPQEGDRTLTLSTCSYEFSDARYVVLGILRELDEA